MRIIFQGLICHTTIVVGGKNQQIAVLPVAAKHKATLSYLKKDIIPKPAFFTGSDCSDLVGCADTDLGRGAAAVLDIGDIPHLANDTTTGTALSPDLKCPLVSSTIQSIFFLPPGGMLFCDYYFKEEAKFNGTNHGPIPKGVIYAFNAGATSLKFNLGGGKSIVLHSSAQVTIANACAEEATPPSTHYQFYKNVLDTSGGSITVRDPKTTGTTCTFASDPPVLPDCTMGATLGIDCVNSQFP
ncbi:MAG TPA: hypothetical protein VJV75_01905 [Candidatus Polarisedimenticolia bacterium]|nr:hypothetical protein [Candidatus Polarisedimenticolia bacterium]